MHPDEFVIFAELNWDNFNEILAALTSQFETIEHGRQGDDWIWIHLAEDKIEIDSFYSMNLEVKGKRKHFPTVKQILKDSKDDWILQVFNSPKIDTTR